MRKALLLLAAVLLAVPASAGAQEPALQVNDGDLFYDVDADCVGDTDDPAAEGAEALRHWHAGLPFVGPEAEPVGGYGCLGGPKTFSADLPEGGVAFGSIRYTWDTQVPGGCCNDVHLHIYRDGELVESTLLEDGLQPVIPDVMQVRTHEFSFELGAGSYTFVEDVAFGEHTAWLTKLTVV